MGHWAWFEATNGNAKAIDSLIEIRPSCVP